MKKNKDRYQKAIITIVTNDRFHQALILGNTIKLFEKETDFIIFVVGYKADECCYKECEFEIIDAKILNPQEWERFLFQYPGISVCCALKSLAINHILSHYTKVIYLDSDIKLFDHLSEAWSALDHADLSLTPQRNGAPKVVEPIISATMLRVTGIFNAGYVGASPHAALFLDWWWEKTHYNCLFDDYIIGIYLDQLYLNEAVGRVDHLSILKHCGYNVAWWNFDQKKIKRLNNRYYVNEKPLVFFHFATFLFFLKKIENFRWFRGTFGELYFEIYSNYVRELSYYKSLLDIQPYSYNHFKDGTLINYEWREYMRRDIPELKEVNHPFDLSEQERKKIEDIMNQRPEFFQPNKQREVNDWRNSSLVNTRALNKSDSYIRFLENIIRNKGYLKT